MRGSVLLHVAGGMRRRPPPPYRVTAEGLQLPGRCAHSRSTLCLSYRTQSNFVHQSAASGGLRMVSEMISTEESSAAAGSSDASNAAGMEKQQQTVDFTDAEAQKLERLFQRPVQMTSYLPPRDREVLTQMLFDTFYKFEGRGGKDPAMLYQASLEVRWIEEWAERKVLGAAASQTTDQQQQQLDDVRRLIKRAVLERVDLHKPLSYITGSQPFFGCEIACHAPLLCPRPETEMWTHWMSYTHLSNATPGRPLRILDMCCGTGCIGVALARHCASAQVVAVDLLAEAVQTSTENAAANGIPPERYTAVQSDMFNVFQATGGATDSAVGVAAGIAEEHRGTFDVLVSNPPYVFPQQYVDLPRTITHWESKTALVGDNRREKQQHLYFQELCEFGAQILKSRRNRDRALLNAPNVAIEVGLQAHLVASLMEKSKLWEDVVVHLDYSQQERWVTANSTH